MSWRDLATERKKLWDRAKAIYEKNDASQEELNEARKLEEQMGVLATRIAGLTNLEKVGDSLVGTPEPVIPDRALQGAPDKVNHSIFEARGGSRRQATLSRLGRDFVEGTERHFMGRFGNDEAKANRYLDAFDRYIRSGESSEDRAVMRSQWASVADMGVQARDLNVGTSASGGYVVPPQFLQQLIEAQLAYGGMRQSSTIINTSDAGGADLPIPTDNDTAQAGAILAEAGSLVAQDIGAFGQVVLHSYMYTSKLVKVTLQLMQDAFFPMEPYLARKLGIRLGRIQNTHFTVGTGAGQPNGVVTAAASGKVGLVGQTLSIIYDDLVDLMHSVDPAYRTIATGLPTQPYVGSGVPTPRTLWMAHDKSIAAIQKIKDSQGHPIWATGLSGFANAQPDTLFGYPYIINQDVAQMAANAKSVLFGDFSNYFVRDALDVRLIRLDERYADTLEVGFIAFQRSDGNLVNAGTAPVKYYANSAT